MTPTELKDRLARAAAEGDHAVGAFYALVEDLAAPTLESIEVILRFMEEHPDVDYGTPGPLVHYVESVGSGYEPKLLESLERRPTDHTVSMLNRIINGTQDPNVRRKLMAAMRAAGRHPDADADAQASVEFFLEYQSER